MYQVDVGDGHEIKLFHRVSPLKGWLDGEGHLYHIADASLFCIPSLDRLAMVLAID